MGPTRECAPGYAKEKSKFDRTNLGRQPLNLVNFDFDDCIDRCDQEKTCNFVDFSTRHPRTYTVEECEVNVGGGTPKKTGQGCFLYAEPDAAQRTVGIDPAYDIFCNKYGDIGNKQSLSSPHFLNVNQCV